MKKLFLLLLVLSCSGTMFTQNRKLPVKPSTKTAVKPAANTAELAAIKAYVKTIDAMVKRNKNPHLVFADVSQNNKPKWQKFAGEAALNKRRKTQEAYEIAYAWQQKGSIAQVSTTQFSPSGDWVQYLYGYYREDGTLAKLESDFRSFNGNIIIEQDRFYDRGGKQISTVRRYKDLNTQKFKKIEKGMGFETMGDDFTIYKTVKKLPFYSLIPKKK